MIERPRKFLLLSILILCFVQQSITEELLPLALNPSSSADNNTTLLISNGFLDEFRWLIESGKLSLARRKALEALQDQSLAELKRSDIAKVYVETFKKCYDAGGNEYLQEIRRSVHLNDKPTVLAKKDRSDCSKRHPDLSNVDPYNLWDESCSILPTATKETIVRSADEFLSLSSRQKPLFESSFQAQCCVFIPGSWTYLRLPAIHEPAIRLGIPYHHNDDSQRNSNEGTKASITFLNLEQDGYLRPYDVAGILWPTGYMLSLCLGDLVGCPIPELRDLITKYQQTFISEESSNADGMYQNHPLLAIELGTGIGATSIALAKSMQRLGFPLSDDPENDPWVVATDIAPHALALTMANAKSNNVNVGAMGMDHFDQASVQDVKERFFSRKNECTSETDSSSDKQKQNQPLPGGFSLIFGSSLLGLFQDTDRVDSALWRTLDQLLEWNNPNALVILAHNRADTLKIPPDPDFPYHMVRRLSASDEFFGNMSGRTGDASDFEISVLQPRVTQCSGIPPSSKITRD